MSLETFWRHFHECFVSCNWRHSDVASHWSRHYHECFVSCHWRHYDVTLHWSRHYHECFVSCHWRHSDVTPHWSRHYHECFASCHWMHYDFTLHWSRHYHECFVSCHWRHSGGTFMSVLCHVIEDIPMSHLIDRGTIMSVLCHAIGGITMSHFIDHGTIMSVLCHAIGDILTSHLIDRSTVFILHAISLVVAINTITLNIVSHVWKLMPYGHVAFGLYCHHATVCVIVWPPDDSSTCYPSHHLCALIFFLCSGDPFPTLSVISHMIVKTCLSIWTVSLCN